MTTFKLPDGFEIVCKSEKTRYGFRHLARLYYRGVTLEQAKVCYYNRTWESFDFQTVAHKLIDKHFTPAAAPALCAEVDKQGGALVEQQFNTIGMITSLGNLFCENQSDKNKWKLRMFKAGLPELDFPDDFESLPEDEKEKRLDQIIRMAKGASC